MIHGAELGLVWRVLDTIAKLFRKKIILEFVVKPISDPRGFSCDLMIRNNEEFGITLTEVRLEQPKGGRVLRRHMILYAGGALYDTDEVSTTLRPDKYIAPAKADKIGFAFVAGAEAEKLVLAISIRRNSVPTRTIRRKIRETLTWPARNDRGLSVTRGQGL